MKRAIILDDEQNAIDLLTNRLEPFDFLEVIETYDNLQDAERGIIKYRPDLLFLDIRIKAQYVFTLLEKLKTRNFQFAIIFVSGYIQEHIFEVIKSVGFNYSFGYIHKPVNTLALEEALGKIQDTISNGNLDDDSIFFKTMGNRYVRVRHQDILYLKADEKNTDIYFFKHQKLTFQTTKDSLTQMEKGLPRPSFYRMSNKCIIHKKYFSEAEKIANNWVCRLSHPDFQLEAKHDLIIPEKKWTRFREELGI
ncbi:MAG: two-component system response regulator LytT [Polaribacter sp.]|jgi:two-component system response regulator LytT